MNGTNQVEAKAKLFDSRTISSVLTPLSPYPEETTKTIAIIYSSGRICSTSPNADSEDPEFINEVMESTPIFHHRDMPTYTLFSLATPDDSSQLKETDWKLIADAIFSIYELFKAFVIIHGTDTLSYTASALSFMLENLQKHVVFTGSQCPLSAAYSDGYSNLAGAMLCANELQIPEVTLFFCNKLFRANRSSRASSWEIAAFDSALMSPLAEFGDHLYFNHELVRNFIEPLYMEADFRIANVSNKVGVVFLVPGLKGAILEPFMSYKGLILEVFGAGNGGEDEFCANLKKLHDNGCIIAIVSQTHSGKVSLGAYEASNQLKKAGCISSKGMTIECAFGKMCYLLGKDLDQKEMEELFCQNIRGEIDI